MPDQAPQTLDEITDKLINDVVGYTERMHSVWSPVLFLGEYKDEAEAALTALIKRDYQNLQKELRAFYEKDPTIGYHDIIGYVAGYGSMVDKRLGELL